MHRVLLLLLAGCTDVSVTKHAVDADHDGYDETVDCDDARADTNADAPELCDGRDNDCDGAVDETPADGQTWYPDADADGWGDDDHPTVACSAPEGHVATGEDCDDTDASVHPEAPEICDEQDNDCDGAVDEEPTDGGTFYRDGDDDGWGVDNDATVACTAPDGYAAAGGDCADADPAIHPEAPEPDCTDPVDYDCDGLTAFADDDGDGVAACEDCDDQDAGRSPLLDERCDAADVDEDCDGRADDADDDAVGPWVTSYPDADGDGWGGSGEEESCDLPAGRVTAAGDCDDGDPAVFPGALEVCNGEDDDCDTLVDDDDPDVTGRPTWYADADGDTYGDLATATLACGAPTAHVADATDCDDAEATTHPGADEVCDDAVDNNCDGADAAPCRYAGTYPLEPTTTAATSLYGEVAGDLFGYGLAAEMDLDGDGRDDLVVGAWGYDDGSRYGAAYVYRGPPPTGASRADVDAVAIVSGHPTSSYAYAADVFGLPDIDGDGRDEWAALHYNASPVSTGLYLYEGEASTGAMDYVADALLVETATGAFGAGDFSGADGGWWLGYSWDTSYQGAATLYEGTTAGDRYTGEADDDLAGAWIAGGDDYDGDGTSDVAIAAPVHEGGVIYVVLGPSAGDRRLADADSRILGAGATDELGRDLDAVGDIDGDGLADLLAGAPGAGAGAGAVYVFTGVDPTRPRPDDATTDAATVFSGAAGEQVGDEQNQAVSAAGDLDLDGEVDFLLASARSSPGGVSGAGAAWLLYGPRTGAVDIATAADARFTGDDPSDACGAHGALGDLDGDGWLDIVLGCTRGDQGGEIDPGAVYVYLGG